MKKISHLHGLRLLAAAVPALMLISCNGEKPELVAKRAQQETEIRRLDGQLSELNEKIATLPADRSDEVKKLHEQTDANQAAIADLENEITALRKQKDDEQAKFDEYRRKYVAR